MPGNELALVPGMQYEPNSAIIRNNADADFGNNVESSSSTIATMSQASMSGVRGGVYAMHANIQHVVMIIRPARIGCHRFGWSVRMRMRQERNLAPSSDSMGPHPQCHRLTGRLAVELFEDALHMLADSAFRNVQLLGNLPIQQTVRAQGDDLLLAHSELR